MTGTFTNGLLTDGPARAFGKAIAGEGLAVWKGFFWAFKKGLTAASACLPNPLASSVFRACDACMLLCLPSFRNSGESSADSTDDWVPLLELTSNP